MKLIKNIALVTMFFMYTSCSSRIQQDKANEELKSVAEKIYKISENTHDVMCQINVSKTIRNSKDAESECIKVLKKYKRNDPKYWTDLLTYKGNLFLMGSKKEKFIVVFCFKGDDKVYFIFVD